ncbi:DUF6233 domain-containing protein [Streptomyces sp. NPDC004393]
MELGTGTDRPPVQVHAGDCHMEGERRHAVSRDEARTTHFAAFDVL